MKSKSKNGRGPVTKRAARLPKGPAVKAVRELDPEIAAAADEIAQQIIVMVNIATIARRKVAAAPASGQRTRWCDAGLSPRDRSQRSRAL
jgi:hypothetical protein